MFKRAKEQASAWWRCQVNKVLVRLNLVHEAEVQRRMEAMRQALEKTHRAQREHLREEYEKSFEVLQEYLVENKHLAAEFVRIPRGPCAPRLCVAMELHESAFYGIRPGDPRMEELLDHAVRHASRKLIREGMYKVRETAKVEGWQPFDYMATR